MSIKIELENIQEISHDKDSEDVVVRYRSSIDHSKDPVRIDVSDCDQVREIIHEISEAHRDYLEDPQDEYVELDIE